MLALKAMARIVSGKSKKSSGYLTTGEFEILFNFELPPEDRVKGVALIRIENSNKMLSKIENPENLGSVESIKKTN